MSFDLNKKIRFENLSPSLQAKFNFVDAKLKDQKNEIYKTTIMINDNHELIVQNREALDALEKYMRAKVAELKETIANIKINPAKLANEGTWDAVSTGFYGQVAKLNSSHNGIFAHDNYERLKIVDNQADFDYLITHSNIISLATVFSSWYRFAHSDDRALAQLVTNPREHSWGTWQNRGFLNIWSYHPDSQAITQNVNDAPVCGFVNPDDFYTNYYLRVRYETGDDDNALLFMGFMTDSNGKEHTLSVIRGAHSDTICYWAFVYDAGNPTQHKIIDYTNVVGEEDDGTFYFSIKRIDTYFEFKTAPANSSSDNEGWTMRWMYPSSQPSDMTAEEYYNIGVMVLKQNRLGFGIRSMETAFYIDKQVYVFDDSDIYRLDTDETYGYSESSGSWYKKGNAHDRLVPYTYAYCPTLDHLFFYQYYAGGSTLIYKKIK